MYRADTGSTLAVKAGANADSIVMTDNYAPISSPTYQPPENIATVIQKPAVKETLKPLIVPIPESVVSVKVTPVMPVVPPPVKIAVVTPQPVNKVETMSIPKNTTIMTLGGTASTLPSSVLDSISDLVYSAGGVPISKPLTLPEATITASRSYWWVVVIVFLTIAAVLGFATSNKR